MELLIGLLPGPQPIAVRYAITAAMVLLTFALRLGIQAQTDAYGFILFVPAIMAAALLFDRGSGFLALSLSIAGVAALLSWQVNVAIHLGALMIFAAVGTALVFVSEGLHRALERAHAAEKEKDLLLQEMTHRVKNKFAMIQSILGLQARQSDPATRTALEAITGRVRVIASVHDYLQLARHDHLVDMSEYLGELCRSLGETMRELRPVTVSVKAEPILLPPEKALSVGLIVNELLTNAFKYAFPEDRIGQVHVELAKDADELTLSVADNGCGCAEGRERGLGTRLVMLLVAQLGGEGRWQQASPGCKVTATFPVPR